MSYKLMIRGQNADRLLSRNVAAQLARITLDYLEQCEREELVQPGAMPGGGEGYTFQEIADIVRIRRLQQELGLDLEAIAVVLHMRRRMLEMLDEVTAIETRMREREKQLRDEIVRLRRELAREASFR